MAEHQTKRASLCETWYDVLFQPLAAMQNVSNQRCISHALATMILSVCSLWLAYLAAGKDITDYFGLAIGLHFAVEIVIWLFGSALLHLIASFLGGRGEAVGLFCSLGYVSLPQFFIIPAAALALCLPPSGRAAVFAVSLALLVCWTAVLKVFAIRGCYGFSTTKAILVLLSPILLLIALVIMLVIIASASILAL